MEPDRLGEHTNLYLNGPIRSPRNGYVTVFRLQRKLRRVRYYYAGCRILGEGKRERNDCSLFIRYGEYLRFIKNQNCTYNRTAAIASWTRSRRRRDKSAIRNTQVSFSRAKL